MSENDKFIPLGQPLSAQQLAEYVDKDEVAITRGDVNRAIATADESLKPYLEATQYKSKS